MLLRRLALIATFGTGFAGLVYEVTWHKYLANLLGSQAQAAALILAVFLGGLAIGYALFGRLSEQRTAAQLFKLYGFAEIAIGLWAFFFPDLFAAVFATVTSGGQASGALATAIDLLKVSALIAVPTILMGGTLPFLTQALAKSRKDAAGVHASIFAINTLGAFLGALAAGFWLLPAYGLPLTLMGVCAVNLAAGLLFVGLATEQTAQDSIAAAGGEPAAGSAEAEAQDLAATAGFGDSRLRPALVAGLAGFYGLTLQTIFVRLVALTMGASEYAFSMVVAAYILLLAVGSWSLRRAPQTPSSLLRNHLWLLIGTALVHLSIHNWPYAHYLIRLTFSGTAPGFYVYHAAAFTAVALIMSLSVVYMGRTMPLLFGLSKGKGQQIGGEVGQLYFYNTLGCIAGALIGGYVAYYYVDLDQLMRLCLGGMALSMALTAGLPALRTKVTAQATLIKRYWAHAAIALALLLAFVLPAWDKDRFALGQFRQRAVVVGAYEGPSAFLAANHAFTTLAYRDDPNTTVAVLEFPDAEPQAVPSRSLIVNGKSDGRTGGADRVTTLLLGHLPALLRGATGGRAAVIGFGTGITVGALSQHHDLSAIDCYEISPAVREFAPLFAKFNHSAHANPKLVWHEDDAFRGLARSKQTYDLIVSEPSNPWVIGVERVFTQDFYSMMKDHLASDGLYAQWFHTYAASEASLGMVVNTFAAVFPEVKIFANGPANKDLIIIGSRQPLNLDAVARLTKRLAATPEAQRDLSSVGLASPGAILATELWLPPTVFSRSGVHTLDLPKLSYISGKNFFTDSHVSLGEMEHAPEARVLAQASYAQSLVALLTATHAKDPALVAQDRGDTAEYVCGQKGFYPNWPESPWRCRSLLMGEALQVGVASGAQADDLTMIGFLLRGDGVGATDIAAARRLARLYERYDSPYLPLQAANLAGLMPVCSKDTTQAAYLCRIEIITALADTGHLQMAKTLFTTLKAEEQRYGGVWLRPWETQFVDKLAQLDEAVQYVNAAH